MEKPYTLNLITYWTDKLTIDKVLSSSDMYSFFLNKYFSELKHVTFRHINFRDIKNVEIPKAQFTLVHGLFGSEEHTEMVINNVRNCTEIRSASLLEVYDKRVDFNYMFVDDKRGIDRGRVIPAPIEKSLYHKKEKERKSILLDHAWPSNFSENREDKDENREKTFKILETLKHLKDEYKFYKLFRHDEKDEWYQDKYSWVTIIKQKSFVNYLEEISDKEIFIVTHLGSYNSSVIDALALGLKVINPGCTLFVPPYNVKLFGIPVTENITTELIKEIKKPINHDDWDKKIDLCMEIKDVVDLIDKDFQECL